MTRTDKLWIIGSMTGACLFGLAVGRWTGTPAAVAAPPATMKAEDARVLRAHEFQLFNAKDELVGIWTAVDGQPRLAMHDSKGRSRVGLGVFNDNPSAVLLGEDGNLRGQFAMNKHGWAGVTFSDGTGEERSVFGTLKDGTSLTEMRHPDKKARVTIMNGDDGESVLLVANKNGNIVWSAS